MNAQLTIADLLIKAVEERAEETALLTWQEDRFVGSSWQEVGLEVSRAAATLQSRGLKAGDRVVQVSENRREWVLLDLACHLLGLVHVPLHASLSGPQLSALLGHCEARAAFVSTAEQRSKLAGCPIEVFVHDETPLDAEGNAPHWEEFRRSAGYPRPESLATILYTSGTTGEPKGVMLSQRNLSTNAQAVVEYYGEAPNETKLGFLPLSHIFARTCDLYVWLVRGSTLALARSRETVLDDLQAVRPTLINGVPYFYDRVRRLMCERGLDSTPGALHGALGGRIRTCSSGGAALSQATLDFFAQQQVPLLEGYGLTETSPVITMSTRDAVRPGSCGRAIPGVDVRIADDGEILTRGDHVMLGYYRDPAATAETIRDGWLHTGDLGSLDADGFLTIIGRKKEILVLSTGKKVAPALIEGRLSQEPLIAQAMVVGEGRSHLAALVVPHPDSLRAEIIARQIPVLSREQALASPQVRALYQERIERQLSDLAPHEQVRHVALIPRAFSPEQGEMTAKLSLRRDVIAQHFAAEIEAMYAQDHS
jgi:long-chain acyl-CoA synthetase